MPADRDTDTDGHRGDEGCCVATIGGNLEPRSHAVIRLCPDEPLSFSDHTRIMLFTIAHAPDIGWPDSGRTPVQLLRRASLAESDTDARLFAQAAADVSEHLTDLGETDTSNPLWRDATPVLARLLLARSHSAPDLISVLSEMLPEVDGPVKIGIEFAVGMLKDGLDTIYNPPYAVALMLPPFIEQIASGMFDLAMEKVSLVSDIAANDAAGAVGGAVVGGIQRRPDRRTGRRWGGRCERGREWRDRWITYRRDTQRRITTGLVPPSAHGGESH